MSVVLDLEIRRSAPKLPPLPTELLEFKQDVERRGGKVHSLTRVATRFEVVWSRTPTGPRQTMEFIVEREFADLIQSRPEDPEAEVPVFLEFTDALHDGARIDVFDAFLDAFAKGEDLPGLSAVTSEAVRFLPAYAAA